MPDRKAHTLETFRKSRAYRTGTLLKRLHTGLTALMEERLREAGLELTRPQALTLMLLAEHPGASNAELARLSAVSPQTMHQILSRLHREGLVSRHPHAWHGRVLAFDITAKGLSLVNRGSATAQSVIEAALGRLKASEQAQLIELLQRCVDGLPAHVERAALKR
jgi:DNA-binding MarR family transcriptional regulator